MSQTIYELRIYDTSGSLKAVVTDFLSLSYIKKLNRPGSVWFTLNGYSPIVSLIKDKWPIEVRRKQDGVWKTEMTVLFRNEKWSYSSVGPRFQAFCQDIKSILWWRIVNYSSGISNRSIFSNVEVETVAKTIVNRNCTSNGSVADGRKREGDLGNLSVATDTAGGDQIYWNCHGDIVGDTIYELAETYDFDFDVIATTPIAYEFEVYLGGIGNDLSVTQLFSIKNGNMSNPSYSVSRASEKTAACVWGAGEGEGRDYTSVLGPNNSATNDIETYVRATGVELGDTDGLTAKGDVTVAAKKSTVNFSFDVLQSVSNKYGSDYDLGDIVSAQNPFTEEIYSNMKIVQVAVSLDQNGSEDIEVQIESQ